MEKLGNWAFIIGLIIALLVGLFTEATGVVVSILVILGLIVGFLNITDKEVQSFLVASVALIVAGLAGEFLATVPAIGNLLERILNNFVILVVPAAIVVSVKAIYGMAGSK
ncbi:MAG: hypothetical protein ABIB47_04000 [Candidatus Woesearchaeota archaeon]